MKLLGGMTPRRFLGDHWQKRPLLVRQAIPGFGGLVTRDRLLALATREDATSRLVIQSPRRWERHDGPFAGLDASMLPARRWTLLVHGLESLVPGGWELLRHFDFIPAARVDDLMVSYAADGGSVGPHDDLYDVFLLQGPGRRRWQIATRYDPTPDPAAAIKVLKKFEADEEWLLEPGDMLYLPPGVAHWGVAEGECFTYSIGFLAPSWAELAPAFFAYLGVEGRYQDPDLQPARARFAVGDAMVERVAAALSGIRFDRGQVGDFLGRYLTMPKRPAAPAARPVSMEEFARRLRGEGRLSLALRSRGLVRGGRIYLDGESHAVSAGTRSLFSRLLGERSLTLPVRLDERALELLHRWYAEGRLVLAPRRGRR